MPSEKLCKTDHRKTLHHGSVWPATYVSRLGHSDVDDPQVGGKSAWVTWGRRNEMMPLHSELRRFAAAPSKTVSILQDEEGFIRIIPLLGLFLVLPAAYLAFVTNNRVIEAASAAIGIVSLGSLVVGEIASRRTTKEIEGLRTVIHDRDEHIADLDEAGRENDRILAMLENQNSTLRSNLLSHSVHEQANGKQAKGKQVNGR